MPYIFERQTDKGLIKDSVTGTVLISASAGMPVRVNNQISIFFENHSFTCSFEEIQTIGGVAPSDPGNAIDLLYEIFPETIFNSIPQSEKGQPDGVGTLDATGKETLSESRVLDVLNKGAWNATTNSPSLANGTGTPGNFYVVSVGGTRDFGAGAISFAVGDIVRYNGSVWEKGINSGLSPYGGVLSGLVTIGTGTNGIKEWLAKWTSGSHSDAPSTLDANCTYLNIGGVEWGANSFRGIGFGYGGQNDNRPVIFGYQEKTTSGSTSGDAIIATRSTNTNVGPTIRLRATAAGQVNLEDPAYIPGSDQSVINRHYADRGRTGTTAQRPTGLVAADAGFQFYDTTVKKPIWWDGSAWKDATGATV